MNDLPRELRRAVRQWCRWMGEWLSGSRCRMVAPDRERAAGASFPARIALEQPILHTEYVEAKRHNIVLARQSLDNLPIPPGRIFSFWHLVGRPTARRGYQAGRSLLGGQLQPDYGGGLCQLSGMLYHLSLLAGLEIRERHPHSRDIYDDRSRYAPLGADATVAYGFKDLRVVNRLATPVCFRVMLETQRLSCALCSPQEVAAHRVEFVLREQSDTISRVETRRWRPGTADYQLVNVSSYQRLRKQPGTSP